MAEDSVNLDDLGLELAVPGPGRRAKEISAEFLRELTPADLAMQAKAVTKAPPLVNIRDRHHALARVLATGTGEGEASLVTGYTLNRISILKADPQFRELVEFYRSTATEVVADFRQRMALVGLTATAIMAERLEDEPEEVSTGLLNDIVKNMADRTGHAPQRGPATQINVNVELQSRMERARERLANYQPRTIEHE